MSLTPTLHRSAVVAGIAGLAMIAGGLAVAVTSEDKPTPTTALRMPTKALERIAATTPADSAIAVSSRLYASSPAVVVVDGSNPKDRHELAINTANELSIPILIDGASTPDEIERLGADEVFSFGSNLPSAGPRPANIDKQISRIRKEHGIAKPRKRNVVVLTGSLTKDAIAVATAKNAGAQVFELPGGDPRTVPAVAKALAAAPKAPVIALGAPFNSNLNYTLAAARGTEQFGGGYLAFPGRTMVALYGHPSTDALGELGERGVAASIKRAKQLAAKYHRMAKTPVVPTFEIIATVASAGAGKDKNYSRETPTKDLLPLIDAAEKAGVYVILDLQPGRSHFLTQAKRYKTLLERPHVGLALDPEWRLRPHQKHLTQIGSVSIKEVNMVGKWLATLTRKKSLPQKVFVLHQFSINMIKGRSRLITHRPELATVIHVDGQGSQPAKKGTWQYLHQNAPKGVFWGWKNFHDEDKPMLKVKQTWRRVKPHPELISYQ